MSFCRNNCLKDRPVNSALRDLIQAFLNGDLCPKIPSEQIDLGERIAEGGFAVVYAGKWSDLSVAVKMVSLLEKGSCKLEQELNLLINVNHPSIIRVFGISSFQGSIGIVMERASSPIPTPNSLSPLTLRYAKELCQGLKFLHLSGVVHGDLKPSRILLVDGHVRLSGFTHANHRFNDDGQRAKTMTMTHKYAALEQFDSEADLPSDIYSLGMVLYELLTGNEAFKDCGMYDIVRAKMRGTSLPFDKSTPQSLQELITRCLDLRPASRPEIDEIIQILQSLRPVGGDPKLMMRVDSK
ncbi:hypothetical protein GEMRC1_010926 [Eukaryota sp. GEM-RC1]